jgi:YD repeat-containing protein
VIVETTFNADGQTLTLTAKNPVTRDQTTRYQYGTTLATSSIARNDLRVAEFYPDAVYPADCVAYAYNRQGQPITKTDQNGSVHGYSYDLLGRQTSDAVTTLAPGVDGTVLRIDTAYEIRGMVSLITSYADTAGTTPVNQILRTYNWFSQLAIEYQEHSGAVNTSTSLNVQYGYADGSTDTIRPVSITYPNGRIISFEYTSGDDDSLSRVSFYSDTDSASLVDYTYLGLRSFVAVQYPEPGVVYTLATGGGTNPYTGLDAFGRVIDVLWLAEPASSSSSSSSSASRSSASSSSVVSHK